MNDLEIGDIVYSKRHKWTGTVVGFYTDDDGGTFVFVEGEGGVISDFHECELTRLSNE